MKIAVTAMDPDETAALALHFGQAPAFVVFDTSTRRYEGYENQRSSEGGHGGCHRLVDQIVRQQAEVLITGHAGPGAFAALEEAGIKVALSSAMTVAEAVLAFEQGRLAGMEEKDICQEHGQHHGHQHGTSQGHGHHGGR